MPRKDETAPDGIKGPKPFPKLESGVRFPSLALRKTVKYGLFSLERSPWPEGGPDGSYASPWHLVSGHLDSWIGSCKNNNTIQESLSMYVHSARSPFMQSTSRSLNLMQLAPLGSLRTKHKKRR